MLTDKELFEKYFNKKKIEFINSGGKRIKFHCRVSKKGIGAVQLHINNPAFDRYYTFPIYDPDIKTWEGLYDRYIKNCIDWFGDSYKNGLNLCQIDAAGIIKFCKASQEVDNQRRFTEVRKMQLKKDLKSFYDSYDE